MFIVPWQLLSALIMILTNSPLKRLRRVHMIGWGVFILIFILTKVFYGMLKEYKTTDVAAIATIAGVCGLCAFYYYLTVRTYLTSKKAIA